MHHDDLICFLKENANVSSNAQLSKAESDFAQRLMVPGFRPYLAVLGVAEQANNTC